MNYTMAPSKTSLTPFYATLRIFPWLLTSLYLLLVNGTCYEYEFARKMKDGVSDEFLPFYY